MSTKTEWTAMTTEANEQDKFLQTLRDLFASGLTAAAARIRWESQPGLVEACDASVAYVKEELGRVNEQVGEHSCGPDNGCDYNCVIRANVSGDYHKLLAALAVAEGGVE